MGLVDFMADPLGLSNASARLVNPNYDPQNKGFISGMGAQQPGNGYTPASSSDYANMYANMKPTPGPFDSLLPQIGAMSKQLSATAQPGDGQASGNAEINRLAMLNQQHAQQNIDQLQTQHNTDMANRVSQYQGLTNPFAGMVNPYTGAAADQFKGNSAGQTAGQYGNQLQALQAQMAQRGATPDSGMYNGAATAAAMGAAGQNSQNFANIDQNFLDKGNAFNQYQTQGALDFENMRRQGIAGAQDQGYNAAMFNPLTAQADYLRNQSSNLDNQQQAWRNQNTQQYQPQFQDAQLSGDRLNNTNLGYNTQFNANTLSGRENAANAGYNYDAASAGYGQQAMGQQAAWANSPGGQMQQIFDHGTSLAGSALNNSMAYIKPLQQTAGQAAGFITSGGFGGGGFGGQGQQGYGQRPYNSNAQGPGY